MRCRNSLALVALLSASSALAAAPAPSPQAKPVEAKATVKRTKIAVLDVRAVGAADPKTLEGLSSLIVAEASARSELQVVSSSDMRALIGFDRERQLLGCTESSCLAEIGGALGVEYLVATEGSRVGSSWILTMTLLDTNRAMAVKRLAKRPGTDDQLIDAATGAIHELLAAIPGPTQVVAAGALQPVSGTAPSSAGPATPPGEQSGYHEHDGLFLRAQLHLGSLSSDLPVKLDALNLDGDITVSGAAGGFALAAGYSISRHFALFCEFLTYIDGGPSVSVGAVGAKVPNMIHSFSGIAGGVNYYFMPSNMYLSLLVGGGSSEIQLSDYTLASKAGGYLRLNAGKEWWVSSNLGLGLSAYATLGQTPTQDGKATISHSAFGLAFSSTYN